MNNRRKIIVALAAGALTIPLASFAQQPAKVYRIGFLSLASAASAQSISRAAAVRVGLRDFGYVEGKNLIMEFRWAEGHDDRLAQLADELVRLKADVIVAQGTQGTLAAKRATTTIPIVMGNAANAVDAGLVASLSRPGGNVTGSTSFGTELSAKRFEMLKETVPRITRVAVLKNSHNPSQELDVKAVEIAARSLKAEVEVFGVREPDDFDSAFTAMAKRRINAILVLQDGLLTSNSKKIAELAAKQRLPMIGVEELAEAGGLIGYGPNVPAMYRRTGYFVDKILKGANPGDIPVERATKFDLVVNMKTAKALGIKIPNSILVRTDKVIE